MDTSPTHDWSIAASPHTQNLARSSRAMMVDVCIALLPVVAVSVWNFGFPAVWRIVAGVGSAVAFEAAFHHLRGRAESITDVSAACSGLILTLTLPITAPLYVLLIANLVGISLGKVVFGGMGYNLFNPAMVGRAFVMIAFPSAVGASACVDGMSGATPLSAFKYGGDLASLESLWWGSCGGVIGETSAVACLVGGLYLIARRTASWQIPLSLIASMALFSVFRHGIGFSEWSWVHELFAGGLMFGAFFIATDPVTSPVSHVGRLVYGVGVAGLTVFFRSLSSYPEGFMFAILLMNAVTPLINTCSIPDPVGGKA